MTNDLFTSSSFVMTVTYAFFFFVVVVAAAVFVFSLRYNSSCLRFSFCRFPFWFGFMTVGFDGFFDVDVDGAVVAVVVVTSPVLAIMAVLAVVVSEQLHGTMKRGEMKQ